MSLRMISRALINCDQVQPLLTPIEGESSQQGKPREQPKPKK